MRIQGRTSPRFSRAIPHSSEALVRRAQRQLQSRARVAFSDVECSADGDGAVVLRGRVPSFYLKQLAQEVIRKADGVTHVVNELEVDYAESRATTARRRPLAVGAH